MMSSTSSGFGSPSRTIGNIIGAKGKLLRKKKSTPSFSLFTSMSNNEKSSFSNNGRKRTIEHSSSQPYQPKHKHSISGEELPSFNRRSLRFSIRKASSQARHSFSFLTSHFRNRRDSSSTTNSDKDSRENFIPPLLDPTNTITRQHLLQTLRTVGIQDEPSSTSSELTSSQAAKSPNTEVSKELSPTILQSHRKQQFSSSPTRTSPKDLKRNRGWFSSQRSNLLMSFDETTTTTMTSVPPSITKVDPIKQTVVRQSITHSSTINFIEFKELYRSFMIRSRTDIKELFDKLCQSSPTELTTTVTEIDNNNRMEVITSSDGNKKNRSVDVVGDSEIEQSGRERTIPKDDEHKSDKKSRTTDEFPFGEYTQHQRGNTKFDLLPSSTTSSIIDKEVDVVDTSTTSTCSKKEEVYCSMSKSISQSGHVETTVSTTSTTAAVTISSTSCDVIPRSFSRRNKEDEKVISSTIERTAATSHQEKDFLSDSSMSSTKQMTSTFDPSSISEKVQQQNKCDTEEKEEASHKMASSTSESGSRTRITSSTLTSHRTIQSVAITSPSSSTSMIPEISGISTVFSSMTSPSPTLTSPSTYPTITTVSDSLKPSLSHDSIRSSPKSPLSSPTTTIVPSEIGGQQRESTSSKGSTNFDFELTIEQKRPSVSSTISNESNTITTERRGSLFQDSSSSLLNHHRQTTLQHQQQNQQAQRGQQQQTTTSTTTSGSKSPKRRSSLAVGTIGASVSGVTTTGLLTRNHDTNDSLSLDSDISRTMKQRNIIWDAIASASIVSNSTGLESSNVQSVLSLENFFTFLRVYQREEGLTIDHVKEIVQRHEPDSKLRTKHCLSFEGFALYLMDKENYAFTPEQNTYIEDDLHETLSHYYMATSHNTYLTGHQLKGDSCIDMYSHVLRLGCRCIELYCWDGEDGFPVIYHGHTLTSKISFQKVIEAINDSAFAKSPFPVILSLENHCSLPQQSKMAQIFVSIFGDKLVTRFMFESDFTDDPRLPSPNQLKNKILIKNKKLRTPLFPTIQHKIRQAMGGMASVGGGGSLPQTTSTSPATPLSSRKRHPNRTESLLTVGSLGSLNDEDDESDDVDDEDDDDDLLTGAVTAAVVGPLQQTMSTTTKSSPSSSTLSKATTTHRSTTTQHSSSHHHSSSTSHTSSSQHPPPVRTESSSSQEGSSVMITSELPSCVYPGNESTTTTTSTSTKQHQSLSQKTSSSGVSVVPFGQSTTTTKDSTSKRKSSQVAPELSDLVNYVQAVKFRGLFFDPSTGLITSRPPQQPTQKHQQQQQLESSKTVASSSSSTSLPQAKRSTGSAKQRILTQLSNVTESSTVTNLPVTTVAPTLIPLVSSTTTSGSNSFCVSTTPTATSTPTNAASSSTMQGITFENDPQTKFGPLLSTTLLTTPSSSLTYSHSTSYLPSPSSTTTMANQQQKESTQQTHPDNNRNLEYQTRITKEPFFGPSTMTQNSTTVSTIETQNVLLNQGFSGTQPQSQQEQYLSQQQTSSTSPATSSSSSSDKTMTTIPKSSSQHQTQQTTSTEMKIRQYANPNAPCYQVPSLNEHTAKKLCRKSPLPVIAFTESQLMRSYPAGMRIDSSNFNPLTFWAFGLQMAAINYQTDDMGSAINSAFFEQNGSCGLVKKPAVMIDHNHVMFGRFNPWEKEFDGLYALDLTITVISGQYVCPDTNSGSPCIEVELIGIPVDCNKQRSRIVQRNSFNPIFNDTFLFRVTFSDLAFIRFAVIDAGTNHMTAQRIIPINCLKPGYRHVRLRSPTNQPLATSTLFIYSSSQEEGIEVDVGPSTTTTIDDNDGRRCLKQTSNHHHFHQLHHGSSGSSLLRETPSVPASVPTRRRMFFLVVHGVVPDEPSTILKITQDSTTSEVIAQALIKGNKPYEKEFDYVLIEEVAPSWNKKQLLKKQYSATQRILDADERPLEAQAKWKGEGRFILKKISDDPSTRAWMSTIKAATIRKERSLRRQESDTVTDSDQFTSWDDDHFDNFLVCVYNVSPDQPYTILKASTTSTAQEIIQRALLKARRIEDSQNYVIVEEVEHSGRELVTQGHHPHHHHRHHQYTASPTKANVRTKRILLDDEILFEVQSKWTSKGLFRLVPRAEATTMIEKDSRPKTLIRWVQSAKGSFKKISRMSSLGRSKESSSDRESFPGKSGSLESQASSV